MTGWIVQILFDRWVHVENLWSILKLVYFDSRSWQSFASTCDVFNCLFLLDVRNEIHLLSWLVCLLGFWLRNTSLVKVGNPISDGIVFVFHLAWCVRGLKSLKRFWPYLIVFRASRMVSLSNYCIWCLFFMSNLMKSSAVYEPISRLQIIFFISRSFVRSETRPDLTRKQSGLTKKFQVKEQN